MPSLYGMIAVHIYGLFCQTDILGGLAVIDIGSAGVLVDDCHYLYRCDLALGTA